MTHRRGLTLFDVLLVLAIAGVAAIVLRPQRLVHDIVDREDAVAVRLRTLETRLAAYVKAARRDRDHDGLGEAPPIGELFGDTEPGARRVGDTQVWEFGGWYWAVMVPGPRKTPVLAGSDLDVADFAEVSYLIVAWPAQPGVTGMRALMETPQGLLRHQIDGYPYTDHPPAPDWDLVRYEGDTIRRGPAYPGSDWRSPAQTLRR